MNWNITTTTGRTFRVLAATYGEAITRANRLLRRIAPAELVRDVEKEG